MRKVVSCLFMTLDGVVESPENWVMFNDETGKVMEAESAAADTLLLGRRTYEVFAASWPNRSAEDDPMAGWINGVPKLVASTTLEKVEWQNSTLLDGDAATALAEHKRRSGKNILINGSATLVRSLLRAGVVDELQLLMHPVVTGSGARLFAEAAQLRLLQARSFSTGVLHLTYRADED